VVGGGEWVDGVEVVALDPILQFAGLVAGVLAYLKHGYYDNLYGDGARFGGGECGQGHWKKEAEEM
jgi:hypothetical protein